VTPTPRNSHSKNGHDRSGLALLFPGQGSQHAGMGKRLAEISQAAREMFAQADEVLGMSVSKLCIEGSDEELQDTVNTQPAILTTSLAHLAHLRERLQEMGHRLAPSLIAGHSLGQYSAAVAANSIDFENGLRLVRERGRIMAAWAKEHPGGLAAVLGLDEDVVHEICNEVSPEGKVSVAVVNCPGQTVLSGQDGYLEPAMEMARERGGKVRRLPISVPSHTPLMKDAADELARFIDKLPFRDPNPPLVSNISARVLTTAEEVKEELAEQVRTAIQWARCVLAMADEGSEPFIEVGPGKALTNLMKRIRGDIEIFGAETASDAELAAIAHADEAQQDPARNLKTSA
jgi:[acyl-carrier-protein] S-malonyltransferase